MFFIVTNQYPNKDGDIEYQEYQRTCINNCISEFDKCLDNITTPTFPSNPEILHCLWTENSCVKRCQRFDYEIWKAMGRP